MFVLLGSIPQPSRPTYFIREGNSVTLIWSESFCDGGYEISSFRIRYRRYSYYYYYYSYSYITVSNPTQRSYQVNGLSYSTTYHFSIQATATNGRTSSYSSYATITTLPTRMNANNIAIETTALNIIIHTIPQLLLHHVMLLQGL